MQGHASQLPRRRFLLGAAAALLVAGCGRDSGDESAGRATAAAGEESSGGGGGKWVYEDDLGTKVGLDDPPTRIAAYIGSAAVLWDFGIEATGVFGPQRREDGSATPATGRVDLQRVKSAGEEEVDLEQLAAMKPDLIVLQKGPSGLDPYPLTDEQLDPVKRIAPIVAVQAYGAPADDILAAYERLAAALGAEVDDLVLKQEKVRLAEAKTALQGALAGKPGLTAMFTFADADAFWVAKTKDFPDMLGYQALGLTIVEAGGPDDYFEKLSWEQAGRYPADVIFHDERPNSLQPGELDKNYPTWRSLPAVRAGQVGRWNAETVLSPRGFADAMVALTATVNAAKADVVP
jgi:iron complex transport system substrate-binding protein